MILPIGTDVRPRKPPVMNWALIALNVLMFAYTDVLGGAVGETVKSLYTLDAARPLLFQYVTYQFLHGDWQHLLGNMLFLWIFGNAVCDRMGGLYYVLFYLAGGVFAGVAFAQSANNPMIGASGAIAAVTTAFLVLFPRVHVTLFFLFIIVSTFQIPAMILIVFKIILWDNIIAPNLTRGLYSNVAYSAHLGGYAFGFAVAMLMLLLRGLPRNQFDLLAVLQRYQRRSGLPGHATFRAPRARPIQVEELDSRPIERVPRTPTEQLREQVIERMGARDFAAAADLYARLTAVDPQQVLPRTQQIELANHLARAERYGEAVEAYEAYLGAYPSSPDIYQVRLFVGLICNRYLGHHQRAISHLRQALEGLQQPEQVELAREELALAEAAVG